MAKGFNVSKDMTRNGIGKWKHRPSNCFVPLRERNRFSSSLRSGMIQEQLRLQHKWLLKPLINNFVSSFPRCSTVLVEPRSLHRAEALGPRFWHPVARPLPAQVGATERRGQTSKSQNGFKPMIPLSLRKSPNKTSLLMLYSSSLVWLINGSE